MAKLSMFYSHTYYAIVLCVSSMYVYTHLCMYVSLYVCKSSIVHFSLRTYGAMCVYLCTYVCT